MELSEIARLPIIDKAFAIEQLGDAVLYNDMLGQFEALSMNKNLIGLKVGMEALDYYAVRMQAHSLKGSSSYMYAMRVSKMAERLQFDIDHELPEQLFHDYPILLQECITLKRSIRQDSSAAHGQRFVEDGSEFRVPFSRQFQLLIRGPNDFRLICTVANLILPSIPKYKFDKKTSAFPSEATSKPSFEQATTALRRADLPVSAPVIARKAEQSTSLVPSKESLRSKEKLVRQPRQASRESRRTKDSKSRPQANSARNEDKIGEAKQEPHKGIKMEESAKPTTCNCSLL